MTAAMGHTKWLMQLIPCGVLSSAGLAELIPKNYCSVLSGAGLAVGEAGQATALVVDAEVTSYLMMGALSPGLKRHSVTLFEGTRLCRSTSQAASFHSRQM